MLSALAEWPGVGSDSWGHPSQSSWPQGQQLPSVGFRPFPRPEPWQSARGPLCGAAHGAATGLQPPAGGAEEWAVSSHNPQAALGEGLVFVEAGNSLRGGAEPSLGLPQAGAFMGSVQPAPWSYISWWHVLPSENLDKFSSWPWQQPAEPSGNI